MNILDFTNLFYRHLWRFTKVPISSEIIQILLHGIYRLAIHWINLILRQAISVNCSCFKLPQILRTHDVRFHILIILWTLWQINLRVHLQIFKSWIHISLISDMGATYSYLLAQARIIVA